MSETWWKEAVIYQVKAPIVNENPPSLILCRRSIPLLFKIQMEMGGESTHPSELPSLSILYLDLGDLSFRLPYMTLITLY